MPTPHLYGATRISFPRISPFIQIHVLTVHKHGQSKDTFPLFSESGFRLPRPGLTLSPESGSPGTYSVRRRRLGSSLNHSTLGTITTCLLEFT
jgi:hypothetical protein